MRGDRRDRIERRSAIQVRSASSLSHEGWQFKRRSRCVSTSMAWCSYGHGLFHYRGLITVSNNDGGVVPMQRLWLRH